HPGTCHKEKKRPRRPRPYAPLTAPAQGRGWDRRADPSTGGARNTASSQFVFRNPHSAILNLLCTRALSAIEFRHQPNDPELRMSHPWTDRINADLDALRQQGQFKTIRTLQKPMGPESQIEGVGRVVVLCSNDYLGLANHPEVVAAADAAVKQWGAGTGSVR